MKMRRTPKLVSLGLAALLLGSTLSACGSDDDETVLHVYAAASLKTTFEQLADEFEDQHDDVEVEFNFAGSSDLVSQIQNGAGADVFASADEANMTKLVDDDLAADAPQLFATNTLIIAVPKGNPAGITSLADLAKSGVKLVVCAPEVPCGAAAGRAEEAAELDWKPVSEEASVTDVLNKVITGEADAGLVYVTDVIAAGDKVEGIAFPEAEATLNKYPIATVKGSDNEKLANAFADLVLSEKGRSILEGAGFALP